MNELKSKEASRNGLLISDSNKSSIVKSLPENFFERVVDLQLRLKREFNQNVFEELISLYKIAIQFYKSNDDPRAEEYNDRIGYLLNDPNIEKYIKKEKYLKEKRVSVNLIQEKKLYFLQNPNKRTSEHTQEKDVTSILDKMTVMPNTRDIIENEIEKQSNNFFIKLSEKRKKKLSLDFNTNISLKSNILQEIEKIEGIEEENLNDTKNNEILDEEDTENPDSNTPDQLELRIKSDNQLKLPTGNFKSKVSNFDISHKIEDEIKPQFKKAMTQAKIKRIFFDDNKIIGGKNKKVVNEIKTTTENFLGEFHKNFHENVFQKFLSNIDRLMKEKYKKYIEISKNYTLQLKEIQFLFASSGEDSVHLNQLKEIENSLQDEQKHELDLIEDYYEKLIKEAHSSFKCGGLNANLGIQLNEEKLKLNIMSIISEAFDNSKKK